MGFWRIAAGVGLHGSAAALLLGVVVLALPAAAQNRPAVVVTPGTRESFKVALQRFEDPAATLGENRSAAFRESLSEALVYSGVFEMIDPKAFLGPDRTTSFESNTSLACVDWTTVGTDVFVEGRIIVDPEHLEVEYRVWDTARCKSLLRKRYRQGASLDAKILAKRAADDIVAAFIGVRGVSSTELVFVSDRSGNKEIYLMDADGGRPRKVTSNRSINNFPSWSPKGDSIVYTSYRHRNQPNLFVTTRGQSQPQRLLVGLDRSLSQYRGVFDPLGRRIAVVMSDGGPSEIYRVVPGSRKLKRLTRNKSIDVSPTWSPNGEQIAFVSDRTGSPQVYVMDADGKSSRRLTFNGTYNTAPTWSPDGKWIAYETRVGGQFDIWLIDPEGQVNVPLITHSRSDEAPAWAPNSRKLAFSSTRRGRADIYVVDVGGSGSPRRITQGKGNNTAPAWGPFPR
jgi:TolB protein